MEKENEKDNGIYVEKRYIYTQKYKDRYIDRYICVCSSYIFINIYVCRPKGHDIKHVDESMLTVQSNKDGQSKNKVAKQNI